MTEKAERTIEKKWFKKAINFGLVAIFALVFFFLNSAPVKAGNQQITFQGKLTNSSGNVVSNGTYYVKLTIWDAASGGSCQYTASSTCSAVTSTPVTVTNGIFSINLGDTSASLAAISSTLFNSSALYLGITVCSGAGTGCDSEMTPRKRITAAPYAFNADYLSGLATSTIGGQGSYVPVTDSSGNLKISNSVFIATTTAGQFGVGSSTVPSGVKSYIEGTTATDKLLVIRGNSSQSGNLQEWQNSGGTALVSINSSGNVSTSGTLAVLSAASSTISSALGVNSSTPSVRLVVNGGSNASVGIFEQDISSNTSSILQLVNYDGGNTDKSLDIVLPGGSTSGNIQGLSAANRGSIKLTGGSLVIGAGQNTVDALAFSLNNTPRLVFDGVNSRAIFKSFDVVLDDGSTTTTLSKNSLTLGIAANYNAGVFSVNEQGVVKTSGTITAIGLTSSGNLTVNGATTLGDSDAAGGDTSRVYGSLAMGAAPTGNAQMFLKASSTTAVPLLIHNEAGRVIGQFASSSASIILNGIQGTLQDFSVLNVGNSSGNAGVINLLNLDESTTGLLAIYRTASSIGAQLTSGNLLLASSANTSTLTSTSFVFGQGSGKNQGVFNIDSSGAVNASGTITTASSLVASGVSTTGLTVTGNIGVQGNTVLGNSDDAGGDWTAVYGSLTMGATPTGNAQVYLKASSTTAVPLLIEDNSGNTIGKFASSSIGAIISGAQVALNGYSLLSLGNAGGRAGGLSVRAASSASTGAITVYRDATAIGAQLSYDSLIVSDSSSTSTLSSYGLTLTQKANYNQGVFYVDNSGSTSVSGTARFFGSATTGGFNITATNTTTTLTSSATSTNGKGAGAFVLDTNTLYPTDASNILLSIRSNGSKKFSFDAAGNAKAVGTFATDANPGDFAEFINLASGEEVEAGDVLVVDVTGLNQYRKSTSAYAQNVAGVITDTGRFVIGVSDVGKAPLALAGLVKVKVTDENGSINAGDYLVSASLPGYAMKYDFASGKIAGIVGMALESLTQGTGKIMILVNKSPIGSGSTAGLNVSQNNSGQLVQNFDLDMTGKSIFNLLTIKSKDNKWMIDEDGYLIVKVTTKEGDKKLYGLQSGQDKELVLSGSSQLENGLKKIELSLIDQEVIDPTTTIKVSVTLTGEAKGVFVSEKNYQGFTVKELGGGTSNATFDWMLIAKRRAADYQESTIVVPIEVPAPVAPEVTSSTPSEESASTPAPQAETPPVNPVVAFEESSAPVAEPVVPPAETSPATSAE